VNERRELKEVVVAMLQSMSTRGGGDGLSTCGFLHGFGGDGLRAGADLVVTDCE